MSTNHFNTVEDQHSVGNHHAVAPTEHHQVVVAEQKDQLLYNQVKLSDGRVIELRESTGADEMIVSGELGDTFTANGAGAVIFQSCLIAKTVTKINGTPIPPMRGFAAYRDFAAGFKSKDWNKIKKLYDSLNGDDEGNN